MIKVLSPALYEGTTSLDDAARPLGDVCDSETLAQFLDVDIKTVQGLAQRAEIPCRKVGRAYRFFMPAVLAWLQGETGRRALKG